MKSPPLRERSAAGRQTENVVKRRNETRWPIPMRIVETVRKTSVNRREISNLRSRFYHIKVSHTVTAHRRHACTHKLPFDSPVATHTTTAANTAFAPALCKCLNEIFSLSFAHIRAAHTPICQRSRPWVNIFSFLHSAPRELIIQSINFTSVFGRPYRCFDRIYGKFTPFSARLKLAAVTDRTMHIRRLSPRTDD